MYEGKIWVCITLEYEMPIFYQPRTKQQNVDGKSKRPTITSGDENVQMARKGQYLFLPTTK